MDDHCCVHGSPRRCWVGCQCRCSKCTRRKNPPWWLLTYGLRYEPTLTEEA